MIQLELESFDMRELNLNSLCTQHFEFPQVDDLFHSAKFIGDLFQRSKSPAMSARIELKPAVNTKKPQLVGLFRYNLFYSVLCGKSC